MRWIVGILLSALLATVAVAGTFAIATTAEEDAALEVALDRFNRERAPVPPLTMEAFVAYHARRVLDELLTRLKAEQATEQQKAFGALSPQEQARILNQIKCGKDVC